MTENVSGAEIADLMHRIRCLQQHRPVDLAEKAAVLALKAELLARIADQRAEEWGPCQQTTEIREIAREAHAIAVENAHRLASLHRPPDGARSTDDEPPF